MHEYLEYLKLSRQTVQSSQWSSVCRFAHKGNEDASNWMCEVSKDYAWVGPTQPVQAPHKNLDRFTRRFLVSETLIKTHPHLHILSQKPCSCSLSSSVRQGAKRWPRQMSLLLSVFGSRRPDPSRHVSCAANPIIWSALLRRSNGSRLSCVSFLVEIGSHRSF